MTDRERLLAATLTWIRETANKAMPRGDDARLRTRGSRTLKVIIDRCDEILARPVDRMMTLEEFRGTRRYLPDARAHPDFQGWVHREGPRSSHPHPMLVYSEQCVIEIVTMWWGADDCWEGLYCLTLDGPRRFSNDLDALEEQLWREWYLVHE